jgi:outer membrane protein assembly factor BamA
LRGRKLRISQNSDSKGTAAFRSFSLCFVCILILCIHCWAEELGSEAQAEVERGEVYEYSQWLLDSLVESGYPFAQIHTHPESTDSTTQFRLSIDTLQPVEEVRLRPRFTERELRTWLYEDWLAAYESFEYLSDTFADLRRSVRRIPYVSSITFLPYYRNDSIVVFPLEIESASKLYFSGGISYTNQTQQGLLGDFSLSLLHLAGFGEELFLSFFGDGTDSDLSVRLRVPHIFKSPFHLRGQFSLEFRGESYSYFRYSLGGAYSVYADDMELFLAVSGYETRNEETVRTFRGVEFGAARGRDIFYRGETGIFVELLNESGYIRTGNSQSLLSKSQGSVLTQIPWKDFAYYAELHPKHIYTRDYDALSFSEVFRLGGEGSLRGYPRRSLPFTTAVLQRNEVRYYIDRHTNVFVLLDAAAGVFGGVERESLSSHFSYGTGLSFGRDNLRFRLEWANHRNNPLKNSYIHVGLTSR